MSAALDDLARRLPGLRLLTGQADLEHYGRDWTRRWTPAPLAIALPATVQEVQDVVRWANVHRVGIVPSGGRTGLSGGAVAANGELVLSLARMSRVLSFAPADRTLTVQPGMPLEAVQAAAREHGLLYPVDFAARGSCSIGGNIATNAGGPRCLKYGVTRDYVLGLEIVLANGTVVRVGGRTHKNKTGFDLTRLFVGSEGLLGVITEATLKLIPLPPFRANLAIGFASMKNAVRALQAILSAGYLPCALELADEFTLAAAYQRTKSERLRGCRAHLIVELDGQEKSVRHELPDLAGIVRRQKPLFVERGLGASQCEEIWKIRREFSYALRDTGLTKLNEDIVVPRGRLEDLFRFAARLQKKHGLTIACFGHAGDGNIHTNVMVDFNQTGAARQAEAALDELFARVIAWGGAISGEHGIGLAKKRWWPRAVSKAARELHATVKKALDPKGILNPGKFV